jgi:hypothetical protein
MPRELKERLTYAHEGRDRVLLTAIKAVHSAIFVTELTCIGWLIATGAVGRRDRTVAVAAGVMAVEATVFVANQGTCPLTPLAERYGAKRGSVSDIFLPDVLARTLPIWSTGLLAIAAGLHFWSLRKERS